VPTLTDPRPTFFVDRSLGARDVPDALRGAGALVEVHDDHFAADTPDIVWLAEVGTRGWIVLTKDSRIRRHPLELQTLLAANVAAFMLTATDLTGADMGRVLVAALPRLSALVRSRARPFIATISRQGQVTIIQGGARRGGVRRT
jgi:predicted nuclease of predicted toxin-antitoxin system